MSVFFSQAVLEDRYLQAHEHDVEAVRHRVARALARDAHQYYEFLQALRAGLIPGGRIMAAAGAGHERTLMNCFVQPLAPSPPHAQRRHPADPTCLREAALILSHGTGVGYDCSTLPPQDLSSPPRQNAARGPLACLRFLEKWASRAAQVPRGPAQMGVLRCDHPDIESFIAVKHITGGLRHFNLSVAITDAFMNAVAADAPFILKYPPAANTTAQPTITRTVRARELWTQLCTHAWACGEPGVLFLDTINTLNNLSYCEKIHATNPCGETPLPDYGACALASIDLTRLVRAAFTPRAQLDWAALRRMVRTGVQLLDRVLDTTPWPLPQHAAQAQATRRIGLGFLGLADCLIMLGLRYDQTPAQKLAAHIARFMQYHAYEASCRIALRDGPFPLFDATRYLSAPHCAANLPAPLRARIRRDGVRHSHLMAIAPTGSIAIALAHNASRGIEPVDHWHHTRLLRRPHGRMECVRSIDRAYALWCARQAPSPLHSDRHTPLPEAFMLGEAVSESAQLAMVEALAPFIDGAVSKTIRLGSNATPESVAALLEHAWRARIKGITVYRLPPDLVRLPPTCGDF